MYRVTKQILDYAGAAAGLLFTWPIMLVIAIAIKLDSPGPVLFKQERPGLHGRTFTVLKFRTMRTETHSPEGLPLSDFDRMTKVGRLLRKTSLDELPQLLNILKGEMSFIGPRPLLVKYLPLYSDEQMRRHNVKPGITGWAQVNGRNAVSWDTRFKYDLEYVDNMGFLLDCRIVLMTVSKVLRGSGVNQASDSTMTEFAGSAGPS